MPFPDNAPVVAAGALSAGRQPALSAGDLRLRPWCAADAPVLAAAYADPEIAFWNLEPPVTEAGAVAQIAAWHAAWAAETKAVWLVESPVGAPLARVALRTVSLRYGVAEAAYWTLPAARGHGVASRALRAVALWALRGVGLGRVDLQHSVRNPGSCGVARSAGFTLDGTLRHALRHADGWHDMHVHSLVAPDLG